MAPELWRLSATQLTQGYAQARFTPNDALEACLARTEACQPTTNAFVALDIAGARQAADASTARWRAGQSRGPLDGVPITVKDNLHVAGLPTSWGSHLLDGFVAPHDELPVGRLRAAGALLFGKTNLPEFAMQGYTDNAVHGTSRNPWNPELTPGGSSGGAAAAVASGCGPLALATDGGGSIRRPASHCGLVGFKPSAGLVPRAGGLPEIFLDHEVAGGIGRSVEDVRLLTGVLAGTRLESPASRPARILYVARFGRHPVDASIAASVRQAAIQLGDLGHAVEEAGPVDWAEPIHRLWSVLSCSGLAWMLADPAARWPELALSSRPAPDVRLCSPAAQASLEAGRGFDARQLFEVLAEVETLKRRLAAVFATYDFILTPATAALPWPAEQSHPPRIAGEEVGPRGHAVFTAFANAAGLPAVALPSTDAGGLPTGIQLVAKRGDDAALLSLAAAFEQASPAGIRQRVSGP